MNISLFVTLVMIAIIIIDAAHSRRSPRRRNLMTPADALKVRSSENCLSGDGSSYRGSVSVSARGWKCLYWRKFEDRQWRSNGLGPHNNCRNPDQSLMPWCRVKREGRISREFCDVPKCETGPVSTVAPQAPGDTELTCGETTQHQQYRVVGGMVAPIESQPWMAAIFQKRSGFLCGGSLIAPCWVLTAAHCFQDGNSTITRHLSVYLGKSAINETDVDREQRFTVEQLVIHPKYMESNVKYNNDIALLKIRSPGGECALRTASARTVCLPPAHTMLPPGMECIVAGYGNERERAWHYSQYLRQAQVKLLSQRTCKSKPYYGNLVNQNMFCAASPDWSSDACQGDSGGPLVCNVSGRMFMFGVVSWGDGCARKYKPGVYTRVTNFNNWIAEKTELPAFTAGVMYPTK